ncbi:MAG: ABC transporter permease [Gemmatimonadetes bacterium]|nr:ABC transporter permease [Gemmatimonadota bacterium]
MKLGAWVGTLLADVRLALRGMRRKPLFALVVVATLGLGIGANSAIFSVVNGVLLQPLPYPEADRLISIRAEWTGPDAGTGPMSYLDISDIATEVSALESVVGHGGGSITLTGSGDPERLSVGRVTSGLLAVFGLTPAVGRDIRADEFGEDGPRTVVLGHALWRDRFGMDRDVVGRTIVLSDNAYEIVGVAPEGFDYPSGAALWIPRRMSVEGCGRGCHTFAVTARLAPGATPELAGSQAAMLADRLREEYRDTNLYKSFNVAPLQERIVGDVRTGLYLMLGAVGLVLLIACANVATLLLVRGATRTGDTSVRVALGASRGRLVGQSMVENGLHAVLGAALGIAMAWGTVKLLPALAADRIPRIENVRIDGPVLGFTLLALFAAVLFFGLFPAVAATRGHQLELGTRDDGDSRRERGLRNWLLGAEVALCAVLLVGSGLLVRTFQELRGAELGYETENILRFSVSLPGATYSTIEEIDGFYTTLEEQIAGLPGVEAVGSAWSGPLTSGTATGTVRIEGRPEPTVEQERDAAIHSVTAGWLETMQIEPIRGRGFTSADGIGSDPVALVNERLIREHFPEEDPIGQRIQISVDMGYGSPYYRIIGVLPDLRERSLTETGRAGAWVPVPHFGPGNLSVSIRTRTGAPAVLPAVREIVSSMDPNLPLYRVETMEEAIFRQVAPTRFYVILTVTFAILAAVLAAVGLYGVAAFSAARRTREIGLRVALGAGRNGIVRLVVGQGIRPAVWGLAVGLLASYWATGLLSSLLYGVAPRDPAVFFSAAAFLILVSGLAAALPARLASRTDPMVALRTE